MAERTPLLATSVENDISNSPAEQVESRIANYGTLPTGEMDNNKSTLKFFEKIGFSLGHVYNDLCAGIWFSYTLLFMQGVLNIPGPQAGALVMLGQVGDAIATPIVGYLCDVYSTKRMWHIFGTILVLLIFPLIFAICPFCSDMPPWYKLTYFSIVILIFQLGWPIVQITHLGIIPELGPTARDRNDLTATRYSASICSNVVVYIVTWAVFHGQSSYENKISPSDYPKFRDISLVVTLIGVSMSVLFQFSLSLSSYKYRRQLAMERKKQEKTKKKNDTESLIQNNEADEPSTSEIIADEPPEDEDKNHLFKSPLLYQNAFLYVFSRLFLTTSLIYMPLWLNERSLIPNPPSNTTMMTTFDGMRLPLVSVKDGSGIESIATVPLVSYIASFIASMIFKQTDRFVGHRIGYLIGSIISFCGCIWVVVAATPNSSLIELYIIAVFFGTGSAITMISSLCITAELIGPNAGKSGSIYSIVTFCDKLITGIVVVAIESSKCEDNSDCPAYYRNVLAYACGIPTILGTVTLLTLLCTKKPARVRRSSSASLRT